jgi:hypothetical protein
MTNQFRTYDKVERLGKEEVEGILNGTVYVFEKIDGANVSLYWDEENGLVICSHNNIVYSDKFGGNFRGIVEYVKANPNIIQMCKDHPSWIYYGEWLVKHTIDYPTNVKNIIWFFDVYSRDTNHYVHYETYTTALKIYGVNYANALAILENPTVEDLKQYLKVNQFEGKPEQEGIVLKNYAFINKYGRTQWAKVVNEVFKEVKYEPKDKEAIEIKLAERYVTEARVEKMMNKILDGESIDGKLTREGLSEKDTSQLLGRVWNDVIQEEIWDILRKEKNPTINFKSFKKECYNITKNLFFKLMERK